MMSPPSPALPRRGWWRSELVRRFGPEGARLLARVELTYRDLIADHPGFANDRPALAWHLRMSIAPILAAYLVLRDETGDQPTARRIAEELMIAQVEPVLQLYAWWDRAGVPFAALRALVRLGLPHGFPTPGFDVRWRADNPQQIAFDIHGCFYLRVLKHYGAPELTGAFCRGDEIAFDRLRKTVVFSRTGTLAGGADRCDFAIRPAT